MSGLSPSTTALDHKHRRASVAFVMVTVTLDLLALGIIGPVLPDLILTFLHGDLSAAAKEYGLFVTLWALMQFLFSPALGALSDRFGRRPVILMSNFCLGLDYVIMAAAPTLGWLLVGRVVSGITSASVTTSSAYIADITSPAARIKAFGLLGAAMSVGAVLGPVMGGTLGHIDPRLPCWVAAVLSIANGCWGSFVMPESLPKEQRVAVTWRRANPLGAIAILAKHPMLWGLGTVSFLGNLGNTVFYVVFLYTANRFGWDTRQVGMMLAAMGCLGMLVQGVLAGRVAKVLGARLMVMAGTAMAALSFVVFGFAPSGWAFLGGVPLMAIAGVAGPATQSLMTRLVGPSDQGLLQGANNSLYGIASLVGPGLFTILFMGTIRLWHSWAPLGLPFLLSALLLTMAACLVPVVTRRADPPDWLPQRRLKLKLSSAVELDSLDSAGGQQERK